MLLVVQANDNLLGCNVSATKKNTEGLIDSGEHAGPEVNAADVQSKYRIE
jgi:hypothetical protein